MEHTKTAAQIESRAEFLRSKIAKAQKELDALGVAEYAKTAGMVSLPSHRAVLLTKRILLD